MAKERYRNTEEVGKERDTAETTVGSYGVEDCFGEYDEIDGGFSLASDKELDHTLCYDTAIDDEFGPDGGFHLDETLPSVDPECSYNEYCNPDIIAGNEVNKEEETTEKKRKRRHTKQKEPEESVVDSNNLNSEVSPEAKQIETTPVYKKDSNLCHGLKDCFPKMNALSFLLIGFCFAMVFQQSSAILIRQQYDNHCYISNPTVQNDLKIPTLAYQNDNPKFNENEVLPDLRNESIIEGQQYDDIIGHNREISTSWLDMLIHLLLTLLIIAHELIQELNHPINTVENGANAELVISRQDTNDAFTYLNQQVHYSTQDNTTFRHWCSGKLMNNVPLELSYCCTSVAQESSDAHRQRCIAGTFAPYTLNVVPNVIHEVYTERRSSLDDVPVHQKANAKWSKNWFPEHSIKFGVEPIESTH